MASLLPRFTLPISFLQLILVKAIGLCLMPSVFALTRKEVVITSGPWDMRPCTN